MIDVVSDPVGLEGPTHRSPSTIWTSTSASEEEMRTEPTSNIPGSLTTSIMGCKYLAEVKTINLLLTPHSQEESEMILDEDLHLLTEAVNTCRRRHCWERTMGTTMETSMATVI